MSIPVWLRVLIVVAALALSVPGAAQKFQEPTKEELQMTSDPKAPGAPAVYLYLEETTDNHNHYESRYARIKVLTEKGKEWATVEVPYFAVLSAMPIIEGRTIHSDGTVIPLTGKAADLLVVKTTKNNVKAAVFNLPSVEVGSILEYRWTRSMSGYRFADGTVTSAGGWISARIPRWDVQQEIPVYKARFYFNPFTDTESVSRGTTPVYEVDGERAANLLYTQRLPAGVKVVVSSKPDFTLDIQDVPAIKHEMDAPPEEASRYQVQFYYSPCISAQDYWENEIKRWSKDLDHFASQSHAIRDAANQITAGTDTPEAKARKLYDAVQALENTDFSRAKSEAEREQLHLKKELQKAEDVWSEKSGSSNDLAALYLALARAAGLEAYGMQVADRSKRIFDPNYLSLDQLDALLVVLRIDGKDIYLDPGQKLCPFGQLHWSHMLAGGMEENARDPVYTPLNLTKDAITARNADLTVKASGEITGAVKVVMNGPAALYWRQLSLTSDPEEVRKQFNESLHELLPQGITGEVDRFVGLESAAANLAVVVKVSGQLGTSTGKRLLLPGFFFSTGAHLQFVAEEKREAAVDLHYAEQVIDDAVYHLPTGYTVESAPQPAQLPWPDHATLIVKTGSASGVIEIRHTFARFFVLLDPKDYPALRDYYQKISTNDQQQLVLVQAAGAGAN
jgi:transglutaminase-like putative cysteine protease